MNEIEKMYKNAGIEPDYTYLFIVDGNTISIGSKTDLKRLIVDCGVKKPFYPPFTTEKQIELIKWLAKRDYGDYTSSLLINITDDKVYFSAGAKPKNYVIEVLYDSNRCTDFENALANLINNLWQSLTEEEKQQIKDILQ